MEYCANCMEHLGTDGLCPRCGKWEPSSDAPAYALAPGSTLRGGQYLIGRVLGQGGFGITYIGLDLQLERKVAIKEYFVMNHTTRDGAVTKTLTWSKQAGAVPDGCEAFLKEARKMAKISHVPQVARVLDTFNENATAYIVMEFVEGETLAAHIAHLGRPMTWAEAEPIFLPAIEAMEQVHAMGVVHRDLSPDNLMLPPEGGVRILDLGAAKDLSTNRGASSVVVAKSGFSPLEQYGERGSSDPRTDVYAMCATLYYALTGKVPPMATDRLDEDTLDLSLLDGVPAPVSRAVAAGLAVRKGDRPASMAALSAILQGAQVEQVTPTEPLAKKKRLKPWQWGAVAAAAVVIVVAAALVVPKLAAPKAQPASLEAEDSQAEALEQTSIRDHSTVDGDSNAVRFDEETQADAEDVEEPEEPEPIPVSAVSLSSATAYLETGGSTTLTAAVSPADADDPTVTWVSSNPAVATVSGGQITAVAPGSATITASAGDVSATCQVSVVAPTVAVTGVSLSSASLSLEVGGASTLTASVSPANATDPTVSWVSSNPAVATVSGGQVTAVAAGSATITASAGGFSATCQVSVASPVENVTGKAYTVVTSVYTMEVSYTGQWKDGAPNGYGTATVQQAVPGRFNVGDYLSGNWVDGLIQGWGVYQSGSYELHGNFINGLKEGTVEVYENGVQTGTMEFVNGSPA